MVPAPAWLIAGFTRAVKHLEATATTEEIEQVASDLAARWQEAGRTYHNLEFLKTELENVDFLAESARNPEMIRLAVWFRGAVFDVCPAAVQRADDGLNISASADYAATSLNQLGVPEETVFRVVSLIESLYRHQGDSENIDAQVLSDADLAVLAADPEEYLDYLKGLRQEYRDYDDFQYISARSKVIDSLLARPQLFWTHSAAAWEEPARENLRAELERLSKAAVNGLCLPQELDGAAGLNQDFRPEMRTQSESSSVRALSESREVSASSQPGADESEDTFAPAREADLSSSLELVEDVMDTLVMKASKTTVSGIKPMSEQV